MPVFQLNSSSRCFVRTSHIAPSPFARPIFQVIGPLYFTHGPAVLEAVFASVDDWPAPCPGSLCPLPFLGETVMFQVPDIDMPPQVASKYRYHRGVHLCSLWPRARVKSLTRTMSGCGSVDLAAPSSPSSRRASGSFSAPEQQQQRSIGGGAGAQDQQPGGRQSLGSADLAPVDVGGAANGSGSGSGVAVDAASGARVEGAAAGPGQDEEGAPPSGGGGERSPVLDSRNRASSLWGGASGGGDKDNKNGRGDGEEWEGIEAPGTPSPSGGGGGGADPGGVFWPSTLRSSGVLVPPRLRLSTDGGGEGGRPSLGGHRRSSLGSASLASVICDSPSEVCGHLVLRPCRCCAGEGFRFAVSVRDDDLRGRLVSLLGTFVGRDATVVPKSPTCALNPPPPSSPTVAELAHHPNERQHPHPRARWEGRL